MNRKYRNWIKYFLTKISPKLETAINYKYVTGEWLDWRNPQDINAKINWLKVNTYYNNPLITTCIDKYKIREYLHSKDLDYLCPQLYGVYDNPDEINWGGAAKTVCCKVQSFLWNQYYCKGCTAFGH